VREIQSGRSERNSVCMSDRVFDIAHRSHTHLKTVRIDGKMAYLFVRGSRHVAIIWPTQ